MTFESLFLWVSAVFLVLVVVGMVAIAIFGKSGPPEDWDKETW